MGFLDEENVEVLFIFRQKFVSRKLPYETTLNEVNIYKDDKSEVWYVSDRKSLELDGLLQCSIKNSKQEVVDNMYSKLKEVMDSNQI